MTVWGGEQDRLRGDPTPKLSTDWIAPFRIARCALDHGTVPTIAKPPGGGHNALR